MISREENALGELSKSFQEKKTRFDGFRNHFEAGKCVLTAFKMILREENALGSF